MTTTTNPGSSTAGLVADETPRFEATILDTESFNRGPDRGPVVDHVGLAVQALYAEGWEIVGVMGAKIFFHRPLKKVATKAKKEIVPQNPSSYLSD